MHAQLLPSQPGSHRQFAKRFDVTSLFNRIKPSAKHYHRNYFLLERPQLSAQRASCVYAASGGFFGGLKKALQGKKEPQRAGDTVEFPPCR